LKIGRSVPCPGYLVALVRVAAIRACRLLGLLAELGLIHLDMSGRPGLALDLAEPVRPTIEAYTLDLLARRTFRRHDFHKEPAGEVRLSIELRHELAATLSRWEAEVAPHAEFVPPRSTG
jgi:CRISPR/Cas system-associated endonuclease Cas1